MRQKTLRTYLAEELKKYLNNKSNPSLRHSFLLEEAKKDVRVAELSQAYFYSCKDDRANEYFELTGEKYNNYDHFFKSSNKFVELYKLDLNSKMELKELYRVKLLVYKEKLGLKMYKVAKLAKTNQSNVDRFFNKKELNVLSTKKLELLMRVMRRTVLLNNRLHN